MQIIKLKSKPRDLKKEIRMQLIMQQQGEVIKDLSAASSEQEILSLLRKIDELNSQKVKISKEVQ